MALPQINGLTELEYLEGEQDSLVKHEYVNGQAFAMAGSSRRHNRIALNIVKALDQKNKNQCEVYASDIKVRIESRKSYYYPDVVMDCSGEMNDEYYLEQPCLIAEVLSGSTLRKDYQEKLLAYQTIPSLQAYLIVAQDKAQVDYFYRSEDGSWWVEHFVELEDVIDIVCGGVSLSLKEVYTRISF